MEDGWLAPDGTFFPVSPRGHWDAAERLAKCTSGYYWGDSQHHLEKKGWIKLSCGEWIHMPYYHNGMVRYTMPTKAQLDFIFDWCRVRKLKYPPPYIEMLLGNVDE